MSTSVIADAVANLYLELSLPQPTVEQSVIALSTLVSSFNLMCAELSGLTIPVAGEFLLRRGGVIEPPETLTAEPLAGFLYATPNYGCIFVERDDLFVRRRFSAAHELGHYVLHFRPRFSESLLQGEPLLEALPRSDEEAEPGEFPLGQIALPSVDNQPLPFEQMEREANEFAAELLMPVGIVQALIDRYRRYLDGEDLFRRLASEMLVSRAAVRWRLRNLGVRGSASEPLN
jgi:hypothetical protein